MEICAIVVLAFCTCFVGSSAKITNKYAIKHPPPPAVADGPLQPVVVGENGEISNALDGPLISQGSHVDSGHHHDKHGHHGHGHQEESGGHHGHRGVSDREGRGHHKKGHARSKDRNHRSKSGPRLVAANRAISADQDQADAKLCSAVKCKRRHVCVVNAESGVAECIHKKLLKHRRKEMRAARLSAKATDNLKKLRSKKKQHFEKMTKAEHFQDRYEEKKRHRLHHLRQLSAPDTEQHSEYVTGTPGREYSAFSKENLTISMLQHCSPKDLAVMGKRLLDWFKVIRDKDPHHHDHVIQKRNSMKKELHEKDECICQAPVRYEFLSLDDDMDDNLSPKELGRLESNGYEHCIQPFIESCDHDLDGHLSNKEWCCCFADVLPPCLADMAKVPAAMSLGGPAVMPGAMVPQCDSDGFYKPLQCHGSTGYCWCVDRAGIQIEGTHTRGTPDCENLDAESQAILEISNSLDDE